VTRLCLVESFVPSGWDEIDLTERYRYQIESSRAPESPQTFSSLEEATALFKAFHPTISPQLASELCQRDIVASQGSFKWRWDPRLRSSSAIIFNGRQQQYLGLLEAVSAPTQVIFGKKSEYNNQKNKTLFQSHLKSCELQEIDGDHNIHLGNPVATDQLITHFLSSKKPTRF